MHPLLTTLGRLTLALGLLAGLSPAAHAQDGDLLGQLEQDASKNQRAQLVDATFKSTRLINGHTVQTPGAGTLVFLIQHRFGKLNDGPSEFFGLDNAHIRLGLDYGITDRLTVGIGRSSLEKVYDASLKYRLLRQTSGPGAMPLSVTLFASSAVVTDRLANGLNNTFTLRNAFTYQALLARKFSTDLSLQLMPTLVHRNLVFGENTPNQIYALGAGGRYKITKRFSFNAEYYYLLTQYANQNVRNALALGVDIETGGHIFQLMVTNTNGMVERQFIPGESNGNFFKGDIYFGFNVNRNFTLRSQRLNR